APKLRAGRRHAAHRDDDSERTRRDRSTKGHRNPPSASWFWLLFDAEFDFAVGELETPDESRRVTVLCGKDRDLKGLTGFDGVPVDPGPGQRLGRGRGQNPLRRRTVLVRNREKNVR